MDSLTLWADVACMFYTATSQSCTNVSCSIRHQVVKIQTSAQIPTNVDYCNAVLCRISGKHIQKLQHVQNSAARILKRVRKHKHIARILCSLHWLPITARTDYKMSCLSVFLPFMLSLSCVCV